MFQPKSWTAPSKRSFEHGESTQNHFHSSHVKNKTKIIVVIGGCRVVCWRRFSVSVRCRMESMDGALRNLRQDEKKSVLNRWELSRLSTSLQSRRACRTFPVERNSFSPKSLNDCDWLNFFLRHLQQTPSFNQSVVVVVVFWIGVRTKQNKKMRQLDQLRSLEVHSGSAVWVFFYTGSCHNIACTSRGEINHILMG